MSCVLCSRTAVKLPTFYAEDTAASANEVWSRIHSDPLFAVRAPPALLVPHDCPGTITRAC